MTVPLIVAENTDQDLDVLPPTLFSGGGIAERALRKVGAFSINDDAPDPNEMEETLFWLDLIVSELAGVQECFWLRSETIEQALTVEEDEYALQEFDGYPPQGAVFVMQAWIRDPNGQDTPIALWRRTQYEAKSLKTSAGIPEAIYVDRRALEQTVRPYPVPSIAGYKLRLLLQTYHPSLTGVVGEGQPRGDVALKLAAEWQRFLIFSLAADIGDGPVRRIDDNKVKDWRAYAAQRLSLLNSFSNREKPRTGRTRRWGG